MHIPAEAYRKAAYPLQHLSDEDIAHNLDATHDTRSSAICYCAACGKQTTHVSARGLCPKCQKTPGSLTKRTYDVRTGQKRA